MKNKTKIRIKGVLRTYLNVSVYLGILLAMINLVIYLIDYRAGLVLSCFVLLYFAITMYLYLRNKSVVLNELVSFATEYGQIQRQLLRELELPYALLDDNGKIIWTNKMFEQTIQKEKGFSKPISTIFPEVNVHKLLAEADEASVAISLDTGEYSAKIKKISLKEMAQNSDIISPEGYDGYLIAFYLFDETALRIALQENDNQSLAVGMIYLDNYDEALESIEEVRRSLLMALIDRKVNKYIAAVDGICKKLEKDKYLVMFYRREEFEAYLEQDEVWEFLEKHGYEERGLDMILAALSKRICKYSKDEIAFPHEIGIFLDYPLEDVEGFIKNEGKNSLLCGYWKVYHNPSKAQMTFLAYDKAKDSAVNEFLMGKSIREIVSESA